MIAAPAAAVAHVRPPLPPQPASRCAILSYKATFQGHLRAQCPAPAPPGITQSSACPCAPALRRPARPHGKAVPTVPSHVMPSTNSAWQKMRPLQAARTRWVRPPRPHPASCDAKRLSVLPRYLAMGV